jgi:hypothetical protein
MPEFCLVIRWSRVKIATPLLNAERHDPAASRNDQSHMKKYGFRAVIAMDTCSRPLQVCVNGSRKAACGNFTSFKPASAGTSIEKKGKTFGCLSTNGFAAQVSLYGPNHGQRAE